MRLFDFAYKKINKLAGDSFQFRSQSFPKLPKHSKQCAPKLSIQNPKFHLKNRVIFHFWV
jgi:hypothetical protein